MASDVITQHATSPDYSITLITAELLEEGPSGAGSGMAGGAAPGPHTNLKFGIAAPYHSE